MEIAELQTEWNFINCYYKKQDGTLGKVEAAYKDDIDEAIFDTMEYLEDNGIEKPVVFALVEGKK